jgi:hypothetical protein
MDSVHAALGELWLATPDTDLYRAGDTASPTPVLPSRLGRGLGLDRIAFVRDMSGGILIALKGGVRVVNDKGNVTRGAVGGGLLYSLDEGLSFSELSDELPGRTGGLGAPAGVLDVVATRDGRWIASVLHGPIEPEATHTLFASVDRGQTWQSIGQPAGLSRIIDLEEHDDALYAVDDQGLLGVSRDGGQTFTVTRLGQPADLHVTLLERAGPELLLGTRDDGVLRLEPRSTVARPLGMGLEGRRVFDLVVAERIYAAVFGAGVVVLEPN